MPYTAPFRVGLNVPFTEAIRQADRRGVVLPLTYYGALQGVARSASFSIAGITALDQLVHVRDSLTEAIRTGQTFEDWKQGAASGLGLPNYRLENIFRTNIQTSYMRGAWAQQSLIADTHPFLMYDAINDSKTRPAHLAMDNHVAAITDPIWQKWYPPAGFNCRCTVISLTPEEARRRGLGTPLVGTPQPDEGWDYDRRAAPLEGLRKGAAQKIAAAPAPLRKVAAQTELAAQSEDTGTWKKLEGPKGSNDGGVYQAPDGTKHYVKFYATEEQIATERAALQLYDEMGVDALDSQRVQIDGRSAIATRWRDDLHPITATDLAKPEFREQAARVYQASVLLKNWDFIGTGKIDNLMADAKGNLVVVDAGAAFKLRAQGGAKPFGADIAEVKTFIDPKYGNPAAAAYKRMFDADVFLEREGAKVASKLTRETARQALIAGGFKPAEAAVLADTVMARAKLMVERYNLDGKLFGSANRATIEAVEKELVAAYGAERLATTQHNMDPTEAPGRTPSMRSIEQARNTVEGMVDAKFGATTSIRLRGIFKSWSGSSSDDGGALLKLWSNSRFGSQIHQHGSALNNAADEVVRRVAERYAKARFDNLGRAFEVLDYEYALTQYHLRRAYGWDGVWVERGMSDAEFKQNYVATSSGYTAFSFNAAASATYARRIWSATDHRIGGMIPIERVIKTYHQGDYYFPYGDIESEFLVTGALIKNPWVQGGVAPARKT
jgi:SPP1 gp7 family putative phage head morphogenesis protein